MSQVPDWNTPGTGQVTPPSQYGPGNQQAPQYGQAYQQAPQYSQTPQYGQVPQYDQAQQYGQPNPAAMMTPAPGYGMPGIAPQVPPGMYFDQLSGLVLPNGTTLAPVGRRIGAYFLGGLLSVVTLGIGYAIWGIISWSKGQTPAQQVLGMQTWKPQERINATWGTMFLRGLAWVFLGVIPFAQLVSFILFLSGKEHRALHDSIASTIVLHDPNKVLQPAPAPRAPRA
jgi:uncharacterized RDD family membrane protein YckC